MCNDDFSMNPWPKEFTSLKLNVKVNRTFVEKIANSLNYSPTKINRIVDYSNGYLTKTKTNPNANYDSRVRSTADALGVPPWFIFYSVDNEKIYQLYENAKSSLKTFTISSIWENLHRFKKDLHSSDLDEGQKSKLDLYLEKIENTLTKNGVHSGDSWKKIFNYLQAELKKDKLDWACHLSLNNGSLIGTFRIAKLEVFNTKKIKEGSMSSAWFYYKQTNTKPSFSEELLEDIFKDISRLIGNKENNPWKFKIRYPSSQSSAMLNSWHSDRVEFNQKQSDEIRKKIPFPPNFTSSPEPVICLVTSSYFEEYLIDDHCENHDDGDINDLINWIEGKEVIEDNSSLPSKFKTLEFLLERGFLKENDRLIYNYSNDFKGSNMENKKSYCTLVIQNGQPKVKWDYDDNIYSISLLTKQLLSEQKKISSLTNPDGNQYWRLEGSEISSLYNLAVNIKKNDEDPTIKLF
jgi:hypothetical protein